MAHTTRHDLDYNQLYPLQLEYDASRQQLKVTFDTSVAQPWDRLVKNVLDQLSVHPGNSLARDPDAKGLRGTRRGNVITFSPISREFSLRLGIEPIGRYTINLNGSLSQTFQRPLTADEVRRIGTFHKTGPYIQWREELDASANAAVLREAKDAVFTDFHTHSSGQITPEGLLAVAMKHKPYYYPVELMAEAGIPTSYVDIPQKHRESIPRIRFTPKERPGVVYSAEVEGADLHTLSPANLAKLAAKMAMPTDRQSTFTEMEHDGYRFRYPIAKDKRLIRDTLKKTAQELASQGIQYAELAFVGLDNPEMLALVHEVMDEIRNDPATRGVNLRFMVGIPRGLPLGKIEETLEKAKILTESPYIVGVDFLGYEVDKTERFVNLYDQFAAWANEHRPGLTLRVHAGENDKNPDNVKSFLKMAVKYANLHFRIGHGIYGMGKDSLALAQKLTADPAKPRLTLEFNPSSNIALNNVDDLRQIPFDFAVQHRLPFIVSSDSAGTYGTSPVQLGLAAYYAGLDSKGFAQLREHQTYLTQHQLLYSASLANTIADWKSSAGKRTFVETLNARLANVPAAIVEPRAEITDEAIEHKLKAEGVKRTFPGQRVPELAGKRPVVLVGASGESWRRLTSGQQRENAIAVDMLIHALGDNAYIVQGRSKKTGLSKVINQSLAEANDARKSKGRPTMYSMGLYVSPNFDKEPSYKHLTHMEHHPGQLLDLADALVDHVFDHDGVLCAVGGAAFTRDIILKADQRGIHDKAPGNRKMMLLLANTVGASQEKANVLHPDYTAMDGRQLIKKLYEEQPDLFPPGFSRRNLNTLYEEASKRVTHYGYNNLDSTVVTGEKKLVKSYTRTHPPKSGGRQP